MKEASQGRFCGKSMPQLESKDEWEWSMQKVGRENIVSEGTSYTKKWGRQWNGTEEGQPGRGV